jgi:hypothetical protein
LAGDHVKKMKSITQGTLLILRNPSDQWHTYHQHARPMGIVVKTYDHTNTSKSFNNIAYHILFSNGAYEYEMEGYVRNVYEVVG